MRTCTEHCSAESQSVVGAGRGSGTAAEGAHGRHGMKWTWSGTESSTESGTESGTQSRRPAIFWWCQSRQSPSGQPSQGLPRPPHPHPPRRRRRAAACRCAAPPPSPPPSPPAAQSLRGDGGGLGRWRGVGLNITPRRNAEEGGQRTGAVPSSTMRAARSFCQQLLGTNTVA